MVSTIDEARTPAELAEWLRVWADGYEEGVDYLDDNDARQLAEAVERVCAPCNAAALVNERDRLRDIVRRLAEYADAVTGYHPPAIEVVSSEHPAWTFDGASLLREARAAIGEDAK